MSVAVRASCAAFILLAVAGCQQPNEMQPFQPQDRDYDRPLPKGKLALRKIPPERYPDFGPGYANRAQLEEAIRNSLAYLSKPSSNKYYPYGDISHDRAVASLNAFLEVLHTARSGEELNRMIRTQFDVYQSVGCDDRGTVFFTGYYCPIFDGRKQRDSVYRYPLYRQPPDLVKDSEGRTLGRKRPDGGMTPYNTRREIEEQGLLDGTEIAWLKDAFEVYVATVQGSVKLRLADGSLYELGYAANNGHEYKSIARLMIDDQVIRRDQLSLQTLIQYFKAHPDDVRKYTWQNPRYVFFKESHGGPVGSLNVPVLPYRSLATDKDVFPRACLAFVKTSLPTMLDGQLRSAPYSAFACDQDTGGAIRAAGRCDIFIGVGDQAEGIAGRVGAEGGLYYVFVKEGPRAAAAGN